MLSLPHSLTPYLTHAISAIIPTLIMLLLPHSLPYSCYTCPTPYLYHATPVLSLPTLIMLPLPEPNLCPNCIFIRLSLPHPFLNHAIPTWPPPSTFYLNHVVSAPFLPTLIMLSLLHPSIHWTAHSLYNAGLLSQFIVNLVFVQSIMRATWRLHLIPGKKSN